MKKNVHFLHSGKAVFLTQMLRANCSNASELCSALI